MESTVRSIRVSDWWRQKSNNFFGENLPFAFLYYTHLLVATWLSLRSCVGCYKKVLPRSSLESLAFLKKAKRKEGIEHIFLSSTFLLCKQIFFCDIQTVWKFEDLSITQILREINFGDSRSAKSAILAHLEVLNFDIYPFLHFL